MVIKSKISTLVAFVGILGAIFVISPFALYWFIHGSYERYIWIINGPFPFSNFGSGPFQMGMYLLLFFSGTFLTAVYFLRNNLRRMALVFVVILAMPILVYSGLIFFSLQYWRGFYKSENIPVPIYPLPSPTMFSGVVAKDSLEFVRKIQSFVVQNFGQPIEGFSAQIYLQAFPGLTEADFDGVETYEGRYEYSGGKLIFVQRHMGYISTAAEAISKEGHEILFNNVRNRLGNNLSVDEIINRIAVVDPT